MAFRSFPRHSRKRESDEKGHINEAGTKTVRWQAFPIDRLEYRIGEFQTGQSKCEE